jgi:hypoxanthine phosphoribosyltransferase
MEFVQLSSYNSGTDSSGIVKISRPVKTRLRGRNVLIIEDIVDTGQSMAFLTGYLQKKKPASLQICCLLDKPSRRKVEVPVIYRGFTAPDKFVVGYGMDYAERYRNLPDIHMIEDS